MLQETIKPDQMVQDDHYIILGNECLVSGAEPQSIIRTFKTYISSAQCYPFYQVIDNFNPEKNGLLLQQDGLTYDDIQALQLTDGLLLIWGESDVFLKDVQAEVTDDWLYIDAGNVAEESHVMSDIKPLSLSGYTVFDGLHHAERDSVPTDKLPQTGIGAHLQDKFINELAIHRSFRKQKSQPASYLDFYDDIKHATWCSMSTGI